MAKRRKATRHYKITQSYFRELLAIKRKIWAYEEEIEEQSTLLKAIGYEGASSSRTVDVVGNTVSEILKTKENLETEVLRYNTIIEESLEVLGHISDSPAYTILHLRYFGGMKFKDIPEAMIKSDLGYIGEDYMYELHRDAMYKLYRFLPREHKQ